MPNRLRNGSGILRRQIKIVRILDKKGFGSPPKPFFIPFANRIEPFANPMPDAPTGIPCPDCSTLIPADLESLLDPGREFICPCCGCRLVLMREASAQALGELEKVAEAQRNVAKKSRVNL